MEMYYGSKGVNNFIEVCIKEKDFEEDKQLYVVRMLEDNDIKGIIKPAVSKLDNDIFLRYQVNSFFVLDKFFMKIRPDIEMLYIYLQCICECIRNVESYLLNPNDLVISASFMLWDDKNKKLSMIYSPFYNKDIRIQLKEFMEYIMQIFDYKSASGTMKMHHIYEKVTEEDFDIKSIADFEGLKNETYLWNDNGYNNLYKDFDVEADNDENKKSCFDMYTFTDDKKDYDINEAVIVKEDNSHEIIIGVNAITTMLFFLIFIFMSKEKIFFLMFIISIIILVVNSIIYIFKKEKEDKIDIDQSMSEFERNIHSYVESCFDDKPEKKQYKLIPLNDGMLEPIILNPDNKEVIIGRGKAETDYRLNKEQISRVHAAITIENNNIYIEDKNSTNGTYVNSVKLKAYERLKVDVGDLIKLANEEFFVA